MLIANATGLLGTVTLFIPGCAQTTGGYGTDTHIMAKHQFTVGKADTAWHRFCFYRIHLQI